MGLTRYVTEIDMAAGNQDIVVPCREQKPDGSDGVFRKLNEYFFSWNGLDALDATIESFKSMDKEQPPAPAIYVSGDVGWVNLRTDTMTPASTINAAYGIVDPAKNARYMRFKITVNSVQAGKLNIQLNMV